MQLNVLCIIQINLSKNLELPKDKGNIQRRTYQYIIITFIHFIRLGLTLPEAEITATAEAAAAIATGNNSTEHKQCLQNITQY